MVLGQDEPFRRRTCCRMQGAGSGCAGCRLQLASADKTSWGCARRAARWLLSGASRLVIRAKPLRDLTLVLGRNPQESWWKWGPGLQPSIFALWGCTRAKE